VTPAGEPGSYSAEGRVEMQWDPSAGGWRQEWEWRPPPGAAPGTRYLLAATVADGKGGISSRQVGATETVEVLAPGRIAFTSDRDGGDGVYAMNTDGTDLVPVARGLGPLETIAWSPDGAAIVVSDGFNLFLVERDGSGWTRVTDAAAWGFGCYSPCFTGDGTRIAFVGGIPGTTYEVYLVNLDGTDPRDRGVRGPWKLTDQSWPYSGTARTLAAHPDGQRLVVDGGGTFWPNEYVQSVVTGWPGSSSGGVFGPSDTYEVLYGGVPSPVVTNLTGGSFGKAEVAISLDGDKLCWGFSPEWWTYTAPPGAPGSAVRAGDAPSLRETCRFSPDGNRVTYQVRNSATDCEIYSADLSGANPRNLSNHPAFDDDSVWSPR
ncbi:MAG: hypothetical protein AB1758_27255, partial [Candidatus Eremiobacterota bacterium]